MSHLVPLQPAAALATLALSALALSACGSSSSTSTGTGSTATTRKSSTDKSPGNQSAIRHFGREATSSQAEQIEAALHGYLAARAAGEVKVACSYLSEAAKRTATNGGESCAHSVRTSTERLSTATRSSLAKVDVTSTRVKGPTGFAFYDGADGAEQAMAMDREGGAWKVLNRVPVAPAHEGSGS